MLAKDVTNCDILAEDLKGAEAHIRVTKCVETRRQLLWSIRNKEAGRHPRLTDKVHLVRGEPYGQKYYRIVKSG